MKVQNYYFQLLPAILLVASVCLLILPRPVLSQENPCDPYLLQPKQNPLGYRLRGDRCEGQYIEQVASTAISVASLTSGFEEYDLNSDKPLQIEWPRLGEEDVRLRAHGIKWKLYYRMDAARSAGATTFQWPVGILSALNIPKRTIGIVGWTQKGFGETTQKVYLPLQIRQTQSLEDNGAYRLVLWPGVQLKEVYVSLASIDEEGMPKELLQEGIPLGYGFYPAQRAIPMSLRGFLNPGIYHLTISATLQKGTDTTLQLLVYHSES